MSYNGEKVKGFIKKEKPLTVSKENQSYVDSFLFESKKRSDKTYNLVKVSLKKFFNVVDKPIKEINLIDVRNYFIDHLDDNQVVDLLELCHRMLKPSAMLMANTFEERSAPNFVYSYVIQDNFRISFRAQHHLTLPWNYRSNRELISLLAAFRFVKSFIYRNGVREFLFQRV